MEIRRLIVLNHDVDHGSCVSPIAMIEFEMEPSEASAASASGSGAEES